MKKTFLSLSFMIILAGVGLAQRVDSNSTSTTNTNTSVNNGNVVLQSGTQIAAQLQNSLDVKKANVGDEVVLKTTKDIKQNGQVVIKKGSRLFGRVTEVQRKTKENATSQIGVLFDRLEQNGNSLPIDAVITSITQTQSRTNVNNTSTDSDVMGSSTTRTTSSGGGLLGGVTNTVGGVVNSTTSTVGGVTNTVGQIVGGATNTVGGTLRGLQISQSVDASAGSGSTLSLAGGNLRLEKGTTFNLRLNEASTTQNPQTETKKTRVRPKQNPNEVQ